MGPIFSPALILPLARGQALPALKLAAASVKEMNPLGGIKPLEQKIYSGEPKHIYDFGLGSRNYKIEEREPC